MISEEKDQVNSKLLQQEEDEMETLKRVQNTLQRREESLRILSIQQAEHKELLEKKNLELAQTKSIFANLTSKLGELDDQLNNQRISKLLLFEKLQKLQDLIDAQSKQDIKVKDKKLEKLPEQKSEIEAYANFYQESKINTNQNQVSQSKEKKNKQSKKNEEINEDEIDISKELEALGLDNILHKY